MSAIYPNVDPDGLLEYSVVYTDRSLNHMSQQFQAVMRDLYSSLKDVYKAESVVIVPGSGSFGMEAVARQFTADKKCLVIQNGLFSYRWSQIFEAGSIPSSWSVLKASPVEEGSQASYAPCPIEKVADFIQSEKPDFVFAPHVETSAGMMIPDSYIKSISNAVHAYGGLFVLDCIASGTIWVDMEALGVDILISAPQKGWSGTPCCGIVMLSPLALEIMDGTQSSSFACDLKKWHEIMMAYVKGGHAYHATMPTDSLLYFRDAIKELEAFGFDLAKTKQIELGEKVRALMATYHLKNLVAPGFEAPGVIVSYNKDAGFAGKMVAQGIQIAAGVPIKCDEPVDFQTFRLGLFGLDKLKNVDDTVARLKKGLQELLK